MIKDFSRLAGELGFEHQVVEGQWRRFSEDQLRDLVAYSKERGVSIWVWVHSRDQHDAGERRKLFARLHGLGIAGIKVDFLDHEAKETIDLYQAILKDAAEQQLMVDFHGANKPTGEPRTWPNEMTREGIRGLEYRRTPAWAEHNTTLPFTRFLAGHADYTPLLFGERRKDTTWAHQIATLVVFTSPVMIYGANPQSVLENPARDLIRTIPSVWDETLVLPPSAVGELAVFARRSGDRWFVGVLNGPNARSLQLSLGVPREGEVPGHAGARQGGGRRGARARRARGPRARHARDPPAGRRRLRGAFLTLGAGTDSCALGLIGQVVRGEWPLAPLPALSPGEPAAARRWLMEGIPGCPSIARPYRPPQGATPPRSSPLR